MYRQCVFCCVLFGVMLMYHRTPRIHLISTRHLADGEAKSSWGAGMIRSELTPGALASSQNSLRASRTRTRAQWGTSPGGPQGRGPLLGQHFSLHPK